MNRSSQRRCSLKKGVLKTFSIFAENTCVEVFLINLGIFKNTYFEEHLLTTPSVRNSTTAPLTLLAAISQNGQTHSNNSSAICRRIV